MKLSKIFTIFTEWDLVVFLIISTISANLTKSHLYETKPASGQHGILPIHQPTMKNNFVKLLELRYSTSTLKGKVEETHTQQWKSELVTLWFIKEQILWKVFKNQHDFMMGKVFFIFKMIYRMLNWFNVNVYVLCWPHLRKKKKVFVFLWFLPEF